MIDFGKGDPNEPTDPIIRERSLTCSADDGGESNHSSVYASSEPTRKSRSSASRARRS